MLREEDLRAFCGSESLFRHCSGHLLYTEGVQYLAKHGKAYWLIDAIASHQSDVSRRGDLKYFQLWELDKKGQSAILTCRADTGVEPEVTQEIEYTDFPLPYIKLYVCGNIVMLPNEY